MARKIPRLGMKKVVSIPSSEAIYARYALNIVTDRLRRLEDFSRRMAIDNPPISLEQYTKRLKKRKRDLSKQIERSAGLPKQAPNVNTRVHPMPLILRPSVAESFDSTRYGFRPGNYRYHVGSGYVSQRALFRRDERYIEHDSRCGFDEDTTNFETTGDLIVQQWLDDDASIWRDDIPDCYITHNFILWKLPTPRLCDVHVTCQFIASQYLQFSNSADDGGGFASGISLCPYDGNDLLNYIIWQTMGNFVGTSPSGTYQCQNMISCEFDRPKGSQIFVVGGHHIMLCAQDGMVEALGTLGVDGGRLTWIPLPELWYSMVSI